MQILERVDIGIMSFQVWSPSNIFAQAMGATTESPTTLLMIDLTPEIGENVMEGFFPSC